MPKNAIRWVRYRTLWVWVVFAAALVLSAACSDLTVPRFTQQGDDTLVQDTSKAG